MTDYNNDPMTDFAQSTKSDVGLYVRISPHITGQTARTRRSNGDSICANSRLCVEYTYLRFSRGGLIVAIRGSTEGSARSVFTGSNTSSLGQVLLTLGLSNLDLLLLTTATEFFRLEGVLRLELSSAMLGNVSLSHDDCDCFGTRGRW